MINEQQQERACLYALGTLPDDEAHAFEVELLANAELRELVRALQNTTDLLAKTAATAKAPAALRGKVLARIDATRATHRAAGQPASPAEAGLSFIEAAANEGWKALPVPGAFIKLLSFERERGYAVLLGKLEPGTRYPAHLNAGPEDFLILSGDLVIGERKMVAGDFHHAEGGSHHAENYSVGGCTLLAVLTTDDPLVALAQA